MQTIKAIKQYFKNPININIPASALGGNVYYFQSGVPNVNIGDVITDYGGNTAQVTGVSGCKVVLSNALTPPFVYTLPSVMGSLGDTDKMIFDNADIRVFLWLPEGWNVTKYTSEDTRAVAKVTIFLFSRYDYETLTSEEHYDILGGLENLLEYVIDDIERNLGTIQSYNVYDFNRGTILTDTLQKERIIQGAYTGVYATMNIALKHSCCK